jgi:hypothetical protein
MASRLPEPDAMSFVIRGLSPDTFRPLFALDDAALAARNIRRVVADADRGFPCRVTLEDARQGETLLLLPFLHHDVAGPYRASGPIYVRKAAMQQPAAVPTCTSTMRARAVTPAGSTRTDPRDPRPG